MSKNMQLAPYTESSNSTQERALDQRQPVGIVNQQAIEQQTTSIVSKTVSWIAHSPTAVQVLAAEAAIIFTMHPHWWMVKGMFAVGLAAALKDAVQIVSKSKSE